MALDFPSNPTNGQVFQDYFWDAATGAWRGIGSANNLGVQVGQLRTASPIAVASQAERDAQYPTPAQGMSVYRTDLGVTQRYYGLFNSSTNPGGRDTAGWYNTEKSQGLVPVAPTSVVASSGSASINSMGTISFSGVTNLKLVGCFNSAYRHYKILVNIGSLSATSTVFAGWLNGTTTTNSGYFNVGDRRAYSGTTFADYASFNNDSQFSLVLPDISYNSGTSNMVIDVFNPYTTEATYAISTSYSTYSSLGFNLYRTASAHTATSRDGFNIFMAAGNTMNNGTITVYGYNS